MAGNEKETVVTALVMDFETGGTNCVKCAATQISIHAVRLDTFEMMESLNLYIYPYQYKDAGTKPKKKVLKSKFDNEEEESGALMEYTAKAQEVSGITMEMLQEKGLPLEEVCDRIIDFIIRNTFKVSKAWFPFFVGQNILFDLGFLQQIMVYTGRWDDLTKVIRGSKDFWGNFQPYYLDTITLCQCAMNHDRNINSYKLELEAEMLGIELDDAHDADADVQATEDILKVLSVRMRAEGGDTSMVNIAETKKKKLRDHFKI